MENKKPYNLLGTVIALSIVGWFQFDTIQERTESSGYEALRKYVSPILSGGEAWGGGEYMRSLNSIRSITKSSIDGEQSTSNAPTAKEDKPATVAEVSEATSTKSETPPENSGGVSKEETKKETEPVIEPMHSFVQTSGHSRILTAGDSMMGEIAYALRRKAKNGGFSLNDHHKPSTGLSNPNYYDWRKELPAFLEKEKPDTVIFMIGTNDAQDMKTKDGKWVRFGTDGWKEEYKHRIGIIYEAVRNNKASLYWIGVPPMRSPDFDRKMRIVADVTRAASQTEGFAFIPTNDILGTADTFTKDKERNGKRTTVRADDGIHLTVTGGEMVSEAVWARFSPTSPVKETTEIVSVLPEVSAQSATPQETKKKASPSHPVPAPKRAEDTSETVTDDSQRPAESEKSERIPETSDSNQT